MLGDDHPETLSSTANLAALYESEGRYEDSEQLLLEALEGRRRVLGDDHPDTILSIDNLVFLYGKQGRYEEAEPLAREFVAGTPEDHPAYGARKKMLTSILAALERE